MIDRSTNVRRALRQRQGGFIINPFRFGGGGGGGGDPYWANVSSLLHMNGADGSTTFTDQKTRTWTAANGARIETDESKFGGAAGWFLNAPGTGSNNGSTISAPNDDGMRFGTGDWTVEGWFLPSAPLLGFGGFFIKGQNSVDGLTLCVTPTSLTLRANGTTDSTASVSLSTSLFTHVAFVRNGGNILMFAGGALAGTFARSFNHVDAGSTFIGTATGDTRFAYRGYIDELRVTKGVARYTSAFTPPATAFPDF